MTRMIAGALACFLMITGAFLLWQGRAQSGPVLPAPPAKTSSPAILAAKPLEAPHATAKSREQKRFSRADRDNDGKIVLDELLQPRRKSYAKLDEDGDGKLSFEEWAHTTIDKFRGADGDGKLSFEEWAHSTIDKFRGADGDSNGLLTSAEYATTAPKPRPKPKCGC